MIEFQGWPKTPRLFRDMTITEKIDGTNAAVVIEEDDGEHARQTMATYVLLPGGEGFWVGAQSRKRLITPESDNFGFAKWVFENATELVKLLGPGRHFGEWWGSGIQRGYGLKNGERWFSLFNTKKWNAHFTEIDLCAAAIDIRMNVVPVLFEGEYSDYTIAKTLQNLAGYSHTGTGFSNPEGIIVYHHASGQSFKVTLDDDERPKGQS